MRTFLTAHVSGNSPHGATAQFEIFSISKDRKYHLKKRPALKSNLTMIIFHPPIPTSTFPKKIINKFLAIRTAKFYTIL